MDQQSKETINKNNKNGKKTQKPKPKTKPLYRKQGNPPKPPKKNTGKKKQAEITLATRTRDDAQGVRGNIMVLPECVPLAIEALPLAIIARGILFKQNTAASPIYWAYYAFMKDIIAIMSNQVTQVTSRLKYVTDIIASWQPKTVPFKTGTLSYGWKNTSAITIPNVITVRNYKTYLYIPDSTTYGVWLTQTAPPNPTDDPEAFAKLSEVYTVVGNERHPALQFQKITDDSPYSDDTSAFAACSLYYGAGNIPGVGASMSVENEVPFYSRILAGSNILDINEGRVARNFGLASGDTTAAFGLPFLPGFNHKFYKTAYPIQYKFLDIDEVVYTLQCYYLKLVALGIQNRGTSYNATTDFAYMPFPYSAQQFRIAVRQALLSFFAASAPLTQFLNYSGDVNGIEICRTGTNAMPYNIPEMRMPILLVENLRMLLNAYGFIPTKYQSKKNALLMVPAWGFYKSQINDPYNVTGTLYDSYSGQLEPMTSTLFVGSGPDPNPIDGSGSLGECVDLNSPIISQIIQEWNERISILQAWSSPTAFLAGSSATTLLSLNRYCEYKEVFEIPMSQVPVYKRRLLDPTHIKRRKRVSVKMNLKATGTIKPPIKDEKTIDEEEVFVPPSFSLATQVTRAYASMQVITEEMRTLLNYMIVPSIAITPGQSPDQRAVRTHNLESSVWEFSPEQQDFFSSRAVQLQNYGSVLASGIAGGGKTDELISIVQRMNSDGKGGFLGELLTGVASVVLPMIPI